jgi:hypothetical protein
MKKRIAGAAVAILMTGGIAAPAQAADDAAVRRHLFTVITLQGLPCGDVVSVTTRAENDHVASCKDGNRYHVFVNAAGRVVVEKGSAARNNAVSRA